ncbi:MAG: hypothetical protein OER87_05895 [Gammaproteobacteria bacterium]|nr:hypothetical protein [Gammaproteobacteria bacterium]
MPASIIAFNVGVVLQAGPIVAMTLVFLNFLRVPRAILGYQGKPGHYNLVQQEKATEGLFFNSSITLKEMTSELK